MLLAAVQQVWSVAQQDVLDGATRGSAEVLRDGALGHAVLGKTDDPQVAPAVLLPASRYLFLLAFSLEIGIVLVMGNILRHALHHFDHLVVGEVGFEPRVDRLGSIQQLPLELLVAFRSSDHSLVFRHVARRLEQGIGHQARSGQEVLGALEFLHIVWRRLIPAGGRMFSLGLVGRVGFLIVALLLERVRDNRLGGGGQRPCGTWSWSSSSNDNSNWSEKPLYFTSD